MMKKKKRTYKGKKIGLPPGSLIYTGDSKNEANEFQLFQFDGDTFEVFTHAQIDKLIQKIDPQKKSWLQLKGMRDIDTIKKVGKHFGIGDMVLEDILDVSQRPKCVVFKDFLFLSIKLYKRIEGEEEAIKNSQQMSLVLRGNLLISFQEEEESWLYNLTDRLKSNDTGLRNKPIDYLFYRLVDTIVDYYYVGLEDIEEKIEYLELNLTGNVEDKDIQEIQQTKRELILFRRMVFPLREALSVAMKEDNDLSEKTKDYLSDVYENAIHILETIETYRDLTSNLMDLYLTGISNRMNEVMKVLTIIATIFIPLTFIAGVYGMNFQYMPELDYKWAYPAVMLFMAAIVAGMIFYFKRKKWL